MKPILLTLAALSLVSCATKPWMVGSANDRIKPAPIPGGVWTRDVGKHNSMEAARHEAKKEIFGYHPVTHTPGSALNNG